MVWIYSATEPEGVEIKNHLGQKQRTVNFNIEELPKEDESGYKWRYECVTLEPGIWNYDALVAAIIKAHYTDDEREAIVNNYLADPKADIAQEEMNQLQEWRATAKEIAKERLEILN